MKKFITISLFVFLINSHNNLFAENYYKMAQNALRQGHSKEAMDYLRMNLKFLLETDKKGSGKRDYELARVYRLLGQYDKAIAVHSKALIKLSKGGAYPKILLYSSTSAHYSGLGMNYAMKGQYDKAIAFYKKSYAIDEKQLGPVSYFSARFYNNMGSTLLYKGEYKKARPYLVKSLKIARKKLGPNHLYLSEIYYNLSRSFKPGENLKQVTIYATQAVSIATLSRGLGPNHPSTKKYAEYLKKLKRKIIAKE